MAKRKFRIFCKESDCQNEPTELIVEQEDSFNVEQEDSFNVEQEVAKALVRKLGDHFKQKHPKYWRKKMSIDMEIHVIQGTKAAFLTEDGSIVEADVEDISQGGEQMFTFKFKQDFKGFTNMGRLENKNNAEKDEENQPKQNSIPRNIPEGTLPTNDPNSNPSNSSKGFNLKNPWIIGIILVSALAIIYFFLIRNKKANK